MNTLPEGFIARSATLDDVDIAANLFKTYALATAGVEDINAEETRTMWASPGFNPDTDIHLVFAPDGQLVAYAETWVNSEIPVHPFIWACVHPDFTGKGLGTYITNWSEARCGQLIEKLPADLRLAPRVSAFNTNQPAHQLFDDLNWTQIRSFYLMRIDMESAPRAPQWPEGISLQPYQPEQLRDIYTAHRETFRDHFGYVELPFESGFEQFKHGLENDPQHDPKLWFIAREGDEIAGYCLCRVSSFSDHDAGYVNILGVRRNWRKHGLGLALLQKSFGEFHQRGQMHVELGVDASNLTGALRLYEKQACMFTARRIRLKRNLDPAGK